MPLPTSGPLSIWQIAQEQNICGGLPLSYSLRVLSSRAEKFPPDSISEFYGYSAAPGIVTSGLFMHYDWGNPSSWPGVGDTLFDISGNLRHATIVGSPTIANNGNQSYVEFNGNAGQYVDTGSTYDFSSSGYTWTIIALNNNLSLRSALIDKSAPTNPPGSTFEWGTIGSPFQTNGLRAWASDNVNNLECNVSNETSAGYFYILSSVWNPSTKNMTIYRDATQVASTTNSSMGNFNNGISLKFGVAYSGAVSSYTRQYVVLIYNRALSAGEIQQNWQNYLCRFSIAT